MEAGIRYGLFLSLMMTPLILMGFHRNETLMALVWGVLSVQLAAAAWLVWTRTGFRFSTASMGVASATGGVFAILLLRGVNPMAIENLAWSLPILMLPGLFFWLEARRNPERWRAWGEHMREMSALEVLRGRHIPDWRNRRTSDGEKVIGEAARSSRPSDCRSGRRG